jgi:hypothetical protein
MSDIKRIQLNVPSELHAKLAEAASKSPTPSNITQQIIARLVASFAPSQAEKFETATETWLEMMRDQQATIKSLVEQLEQERRK